MTFANICRHKPPIRSRSVFAVDSRGRYLVVSARYAPPLLSFNANSGDICRLLCRPTVCGCMVYTFDAVKRRIRRQRRCTLRWFAASTCASVAVDNKPGLHVERKSTAHTQGRLYSTRRSRCVYIRIEIYAWSINAPARVSA